MARLTLVLLMTILSWSSVQASENRPTACFSAFDIHELTIVHDKTSDDKKDGGEEEEPDCE